MVYDSPQKIYYMWTEGIQEKYSKIKELNIYHHD